MDDSQLQTELERLHPSSFGWALSCCRLNHADAQDLLQIVYLKVLEGKAHYHGRSTFKTWLFGVIRNTAADEQRRAWVRRLRLDLFSRQPRSDHEAPDFTTGEPERTGELEKALAELTGRQRQILHLVFYQELTLQEAADVMQISVGSVRTHYDRAKTKLRRSLEQPGARDELRATGFRS